MEINFNSIDRDSYLREKNNGRLIHRNIAYKEIYLKNRKKYPLQFRFYVIHHIDGNKFNNDVKNLMVLTSKEHKKIHNISFDRLMRKDIDKIMKNINNLNQEEVTMLFDYLKYKKTKK